MTLYDQHLHMQMSPKRKRLKTQAGALKEKEQLEATVESAIQGGATEGGYSSQEDATPIAAKPCPQTASNFNVSVNKMAGLNKSVQQSTMQPGDRSILQRTLNENESELPDRSFESNMPQSQLWFVNQQTAKAVYPGLKTQGQKRRLGGSLLPSVKRSYGGEMPMSSKGGGSLYKRSERDQRPSLVASSKDEEVNRSRNYLQAQSHSLSGTNIYGNVPPSADMQKSMRPLNQGQNRGKFNQLKSLL